MPLPAGGIDYNQYNRNISELYAEGLVPSLEAMDGWSWAEWARVTGQNGGKDPLRYSSDGNDTFDPFIGQGDPWTAGPNRPTVPPPGGPTAGNPTPPPTGNPLDRKPGQTFDQQPNTPIRFTQGLANLPGSNSGAFPPVPGLSGSTTGTARTASAGPSANNILSNPMMRPGTNMIGGNPGAASGGFVQNNGGSPKMPGSGGTKSTSPNAIPNSVTPQDVDWEDYYVNKRSKGGINQFGNPSLTEGNHFSGSPTAPPLMPGAGGNFSQINDLRVNNQYSGSSGGTAQGNFADGLNALQVDRQSLGVMPGAPGARTQKPDPFTNIPQLKGGRGVPPTKPDDQDWRTANQNIHRAIQTAGETGNYDPRYFEQVPVGGDDGGLQWQLKPEFQRGGRGLDNNDPLVQQYIQRFGNNTYNDENGNPIQLDDGNPRYYVGASHPYGDLQQDNSRVLRLPDGRIVYDRMNNQSWEMDDRQRAQETDSRRERQNYTRMVAQAVAPMLLGPGGMLGNTTVGGVNVADAINWGRRAYGAYNTVNGLVNRPEQPQRKPGPQMPGSAPPATKPSGPKGGIMPDGQPLQQKTDDFGLPGPEDYPSTGPSYDPESSGNWWTGFGDLLGGLLGGARQYVGDQRSVQNGERDLREYDQRFNDYYTRGDYNAQFRPGQLDRLNNLMMDPNAALDDPAYQRIRQRNLDNLSRTYSARGLNLSGNEMAALQDYGREQDYTQINNERNQFRQNVQLGNPDAMARAGMLSLPFLMQMRANNNSQRGQRDNDLLNLLLGNRGNNNGGILGNLLGNNGPGGGVAGWLTRLLGGNGSVSPDLLPNWEPTDIPDYNGMLDPNPVDWGDASPDDFGIPGPDDYGFWDDYDSSGWIDGEYWGF